MDGKAHPAEAGITFFHYNPREKNVKLGWGNCQPKVKMSGFYQSKNVRF
jgi:hypothetical protein